MMLAMMEGKMTWYIVVSTDKDDIVTCYGPWSEMKAAEDWLNAICDPNTKGTTYNTVRALHKPNRIVSN